MNAKSPRCSNAAIKKVPYLILNIIHVQKPSNCNELTALKFASAYDEALLLLLRICPHSA